MAALGLQNIVARRVTDDLIAFSGETTVPKYMKFFFVQKIAESRRFVNHTRNEVETVRGCIGQLTIDANHGEESKLLALNKVIAEALADIETLEMNVEILDGENNESCEQSILWWNKEQNVIPRGVAWSRKNIFNRSDYTFCFGKDSNLKSDLTATISEVQLDWPDQDSDDDVIKEYLIQEEIRLRVEQEETWHLQEQKMLEEVFVKRLKEEVMLRVKKEKMVKYEEDKNKRRHSLMNSDHWKASTSRISNRNKSQRPSDFLAYYWGNAYAMAERDRTSAALYNQDMTQFLKEDLSRPNRDTDRVHRIDAFVAHCIVGFLGAKMCALTHIELWVNYMWHVRPHEADWAMVGAYFVQLILQDSITVRYANEASITSLKCVLTQEHLDAICAKYFVPEEVHPQLPSSDATMHERPTGKVGMYTRFFDYANYRIPFSTFFVSVLTHFRIPFSQLSVFGSAKVSHFEILCRVCNIEPHVSLFRYFYTHNYKNGWFGFTKRPNVRACYSKNLDSVKNWNDHFFWVDEFVVPANARFSWFSGSNIVKDRAPAPSEYNVEHVNTLIAQASPFLRFPEEFLCWVGISRNYLLNKDTYPRFEYENGEGGFYFPARAENERPIVTVAKHRTVTLLPTSVVRSSGELSASVEREFVGDASVGDGRDQGFDSVGGQDNAEPTVPVTEPVETEIPGPKLSKKKRVTHGSERMPAASHPPKRLRADYGTTGGSATGGKSPSVLNRLLQDSRLTVEQGVPALPTLPFITSSMTASPLEEGGGRTDSVTGPSLRTVGPSARFVVLFDSSHHSGAKSADPEVDYLVRSAALVMIETTTVATVGTTIAIPADVSKDKSAPHPSVFGSSSSSEKTGRTLSLFTGRSGSGFDAGSIRAEEAIGTGLEEIYVPEWTVTKGFELNDGRLCANMIDHFTPPAFFKTSRGEYLLSRVERWEIAIRGEF
ncbi:hypothetical protein Tco_0950351 [Tanacetum coccineum]